MPELPDLEVFTANLNKRLAGKTVQQAEYHKPKRLNVTPEELHNTLSGRTLDHVFREGKETIFQFGDKRLGVHLMLKGEFHVTPEPEAAKYRVLTVRFADGNALVAADSMALMTVTLDPPISTVLDALAVTPESLNPILARQPRALIKALLMDQNHIAGIGNAYADEILYEAGIAPKSLAGRLPEPAVVALANAIQAVLTNGITRVSADRPDSLGGEYRDFLNIHNPARTHCPKGSPILTEDINKRKTYYTADQMLYQ